MAHSQFQSLPISQRPRVFRHRPYLGKHGREILNRSARRIARNEPDWVEDPLNPTLEECLHELQHPRKRDQAEDPLPEHREPDRTRPREDLYDVDRDLIVSLLGAGLDYQETVYWILYEYTGLDPREIFHASSGKQKSFSRELDSQAIRNVESVLQSAARTLDVEDAVNPGEHRSRYMYEPVANDG